MNKGDLVEYIEDPNCPCGGLPGIPYGSIGILHKINDKNYYIEWLDIDTSNNGRALYMIDNHLKVVSRA